MRCLLRTPVLGIQQDFSVRPNWILDLWQSRKLDASQAIDHLIRSRARGSANAIDLIEKLQAKEKLLAHKDSIIALQKALFGAMRTFRTHPQINDWAAQYHQDQFGKLSRFKTLVLKGMSRSGKSWKALSLFGPASTFKVNCQGLPLGCLPSLMGFERRQHKCILFDEIRADQVLGNKEVFQASAWPVSLFQSNCNAFSYKVWLYQTAMVGCSNAFPITLAEGLEPDEVDWLTSNVISIELAENQRWFHDT